MPLTVPAWLYQLISQVFSAEALPVSQPLFSNAVFCETYRTKGFQFILVLRRL